MDEEKSLGGLEFETTEDIDIPDKLIDQVVGQDRAVDIVKKAAQQRRHVMMLGDPGTGKSMLAKAMAELLPSEDLKDILVYSNPQDENKPLVRTVPAGNGQEIVDNHKQEAQKRQQSRSFLVMLIIIAIVGFGVISYLQSSPRDPSTIFWSVIAGAVVFLVMKYMNPGDDALVPKLLVGSDRDLSAPFVDGTGSHSGALLGDVRHDPFQSGGLGTPAHERVEAGAIHRANGGVLFVDEINTLRIESQQSLLTALQEREFSITGQSERSSGAMVDTEPVPCDFVMVAAGNLDALQGMHPALRSRIRGYGYEVYMRDTMEDTAENRRKLVRVVAQEVANDGKIPHFDRSGVREIVREARRKSGRKGKLTLRIRELGGLVRVAGDVARAKGRNAVSSKEVIEAKATAKSLESQVADRSIERKKDYRIFRNEGEEVGRVNGLAVMGEDSGIVLPIVAEVTPSHSKEEGRVIATGKLKEIAQEAVQNVSALIKKYTGQDISNHDVHIQFIGTHEGVEGDSASISVATAVISALEGIPVDQAVAMTGSLSVRGEVLPIGGATAKIEAAADSGIKRVLVPRDNLSDVLIEDRYRDEVEIVPVEDVKDVLRHALVGKKKTSLLKRLKNLASSERLSTNLSIGEPGELGGEPSPR